MRLPLRVVIAPVLFVAAGSAAAHLAACSKDEGVAHATRSVEMPVEGMTCTGCENTIGSAVLALKGVQACQASFEKSLVAVTYEPTLTDEAAIADAIRAAGYTIPAKK